MTAVFALLTKAWPLMVGGVALLWGVFMHLRATAKVADVQQKAQIDVAAAKAQQQVAEDNLSARKTADVQADADAAKTAATAAQERTNVENAQSVLDDDAARNELLGMLHGTAATGPGTGQRGAGSN